MQNAKEIRRVIRQVQEAKGKAKTEALNFNRSTPGLPQFVHAVYSPEFNYFIDKFDFDKAMNEARTRAMGRGTTSLVEQASPIPLTRDVMELAANLSQRKVTGKAARFYLADCMVMMDQDEADLARMLINRSLGCGVAEKGFNTVWPDLIYIVPYMRCTLPKDSNIESFEWEEGVYAQVKADGSFANFKAIPRHVSVETRAGTTYAPAKALGGIRQALDHIAFMHGGHVIHGETLVFKGDSVEPLPREEGNGILNSLIATGEIADGYRVEADVWDIVRLGEYEKGLSDRPYEERWNQLQLIVADLKQYGFNSLKLIECEVVHSLAEAHVFYRKQRALKREGAVLKRRNSPWFNGDSRDSVKMKALHTADLRIKGFKQGDRNSQHANTLGSLLCESLEGALEVGVSGMTHKQRDDFWTNQGYYMGKIVEVAGNGVMMPKKEGDKASIFLPRLVHDGDDGAGAVRLDKKEPDSFARIVEMFKE